MQEIDRVREEITKLIWEHLCLRCRNDNAEIKETVDQILSLKIDGTTLKELLEKLDEGELAIIDPNAELPTDKGVNISLQFNPELTASANKEVADTAVMAYKQAEQDMLRANYKKVIWQGGQE